jgi:hypothetical protein
MATIFQSLQARFNGYWLYDLRCIRERLLELGSEQFGGFPIFYGSHGFDIQLEAETIVPEVVLAASPDGAEERDGGFFKINLAHTDVRASMMHIPGGT